MQIIIFIFGTIVGSFLNALIYRLHSGESVLSGRSKCPHCNHELSAIDLVPFFSFIFLRGKCRYCGRKISWQYPIIELLTAICFILLSSKYSVPSPEFWFYAVLFCFFIVIAVYDFKHYLILDKVIFPALAIVVLYNIWEHHFIVGILSGFGISGFFLLQYLVSKGKWIGFGDVKLGLLLGNFIFWPLGPILLMLAYVIGAVVGITLIGLHKKSLGSKLPFGVFLSAATIITAIYGNAILQWYLHLLNF